MHKPFMTAVFMIIEGLYCVFLDVAGYAIAYPMAVLSWGDAAYRMLTLGLVSWICRRTSY